MAHKDGKNQTMKHFDITTNGLVESAHDSGQIAVASAPDEQAQARIKERFRLDDYDISSMLDPDEVPRLEVSEGRMFLIWKSPESVSVSGIVELGVSTVGICHNVGRLAFVRARGDFSFTDRRFGGVHDERDVLLAFLLGTVRHFVGHLKVIRLLGDELQRKLAVAMDNKALLQMFSLGDDLIDYQAAIEGNAAALSKLRGAAGQFGFDARQTELLDDIVLENTQAARQASIFAFKLSGLMDARGTIVNNNVNMWLRKLTLINAIFLPLNLIASMGGMSEFTMMTEGLDWRLTYSLFAVGIVVLGFGNWLLLKWLLDRPTASLRPGRAKPAGFAA